MTDQVTAVLTQARKLIEIGWTRGANARNNRQDIVNFCSPNATCFCLWGAINRAVYDMKCPETDQIAHDAITLLDKAVSNGSAVFFNDTVAKSKSDVLDLIDKALQP